MIRLDGYGQAMLGPRRGQEVGVVEDNCENSIRRNYEPPGKRLSQVWSTSRWPIEDPRPAFESSRKDGPAIDNDDFKAVADRKKNQANKKCV